MKRLLKYAMMVYLSLGSFVFAQAGPAPFEHGIELAKKGLRYLFFLMIVKGAMVAAIFLLGLVIAQLKARQGQNALKKGAGAAVLVMGLAVSGITGINSMFFRYDFSLAFASYSNARQHYDAMNSVFVQLEQEGFADKQKRDAFNASLGSLFGEKKKMLDVLNGEYAKGGVSVEGLLFIPRIYAQSSNAKAPAWIGGQLNDARFLYFIGKGDDADLAKSSEESRQIAENAAKAYFLGLIRPIVGDPKKSEEISSALAKRAPIDGEYFDLRSGSFGFWTRKKFTKALAEEVLLSLALSSNDASIDYGAILAAIASGK